jgi:hypothetical protein
MCEADFKPIPADRNTDRDVMVAEVVATPSTPGVIAAAGLVARISKGSVPTLHKFAPGPPDTGPRRRPEVSLPDPAVVELNPYSIRRIDSALVARVDPDPAVRRSHIGPGAVGLSGLGHQIQLITVLGDKGWSAQITVTAILDAPVSASQVDRLRRGAAGERGGDSANNKR